MAKLTSPWYRVNDTQERNEKARKAYEALMTVTLRKPDSEEYKNFSDEVKARAQQIYGENIYGEEEVCFCLCLCFCFCFVSIQCLLEFNFIVECWKPLIGCIEQIGTCWLCVGLIIFIILGFQFVNFALLTEFVYVHSVVSVLFVHYCRSVTRVLTFFGTCIRFRRFYVHIIIGSSIIHINVYNLNCNLIIVV